MTAPTLTRPASAPRPARRPASYEDYLALPDDGAIVEWANGEIFHHMPPGPDHQRISSILETLLRLYVKRLSLGEVFDAPFEVKLWPDGPSREPDALFISHERLPSLTSKRFEGAPDLVIEVISPTSVTIDRVDKYLEYERAGVREYWIIDPRPRQEQADFFVRGESGRLVSAPVDEDGVYASTVIPGFRLRLDWLRRPEETDVERALAWMLADAPGIPNDLRAHYRRMLELLSDE
jgi:Uma2 family endonuclease